MKWKAMTHVLRSKCTPHPLFHFLPPTLAFALGLYYLYGRIGFMFHGLECIFHAMERIFQPMECTFRAVEYKTNPTINRL